jgi:DNA-binding NarL/FixJ family response regulator
MVGKKRVTSVTSSRAAIAKDARLEIGASVVSENSGLNSEKNILTKREADVVRLVSLGLANKAVARELGIQEGTVKIHLHNTYRKLGIQNRFALLRIAIDNRGE